MVNTNFKKLENALNLTIVKKPTSFRSSSIAYSKSGKTYTAGNLESDTHLLNFSSEQTALALSTAAKDYGVHKISTICENFEEKAVLSPIVAKVIIDHQIRTGVEIEYEIFDSEEEKIFSAKNLAEILPFYNPANINLKIMSKKVSPSKNKATFSKTGDFEKKLKEFALKGMERNFPTYDSASGYGSAVLTKNGSVYFAGQYSSFDHRMNIHSEMNVIISALMDKNSEITHLGIVSTKFPDSLCNSCGPCRQFISEINAKFNLNIEIICFAKNTDQFEKHFIEDYLPEAWENRTNNLQPTTNNQKNKTKKFKPKIGQTDYTNIVWAPILNCVVRYKEKILLVERNKDLNFYPGYWNGVSGFLDDNKNLNEKAEEELEEELGIDKKNIINIKHGEIFDQEEPKYAKKWIIHPVFVEINTDKITLDYEAKTYKWVTIKEAQKMKLLPGFDKVLDKLSLWLK